MPDWRIFYGDGESFDSNDGQPADAPPFGVVCVVQKDKTHGRRLLRLVDYYCFSPKMQRWLDLYDAPSVILRSLRDPGLIVKAGEYIADDDFNRILIRATNDQDFPLKAGEGLSPLAQAGP